MKKALAKAKEQHHQELMKAVREGEKMRARANSYYWKIGKFEKERRQIQG